MSDKTPEELRYSRPLDVHKWSDHSEVNDFVDQLWDEFLASEFAESVTRGKRPKTSLKQQFKVLLLDLYIAWKEDPKLLIGVAMSKSSYKTNSRYNALHISQKMIDLINYLHEQTLIDLHTGSELARRVTRIWPTSKLLKFFEEAKLDDLLINPHQDKEVIILNSGALLDSEDETNNRRRHRPLEYKDEDYEPIVQMRQDLRSYNELLRTTFIDIGSLKEPVIERTYWDRHQQKHVTQKVGINHFNKFVRRIFYRGSWELGGRFHGGFWQQINEEDRALILIDDHETVEQDFSGLHINLCYGIQEQTPPEGDPYSLEHMFDVEAGEQRDWVKLLSLMVLNATDEGAAFRAFRRSQPTGSIGKRLRDVELSRLFNAFRDKHQPIQDMFCNDWGVRLMKLDGNITAEVINHFTNKKIPVLTIHDSYITPTQVTLELNDIMSAIVTEQLNGLRINIDKEKIGDDEIPALNQDFINLADLKDHYLDDSRRTPRTEEYFDRLYHHRDWLYYEEKPIYINL